MPSPHTIYAVVNEEYTYSSTAPYGLYRASGLYKEVPVISPW